MVLENLSPSERRGIALFFIATCLALVAWAFLNMSRIVTIPGAVLCLLAAVYFLWPEIKSLVFRQRLAVVAGLGLLLCIILGGTSLYLSPHRAALPEPTSPSPLQQSSPLAPLPPLPIQSRFDRFIFACDVPLPKTPEEDAKQKEALKDNIQAWADTIGVSASFADIKNGTQITIEAKTKEAKARFLSMGLVPGITKVMLEARWIEKRQIVVAHADMPKDFQMFSQLIPEPATPQIIDGQNLIARFLSAPEGGCRLI